MEELHSEEEQKEEEVGTGGIRQTVEECWGGLKAGFRPFYIAEEFARGHLRRLHVKCSLQRLLQGRRAEAADLLTRLRNLMGGTRLVPHDPRDACGAATPMELLPSVTFSHSGFD